MTVDDLKNDKPKEQRKEKPIFVTGDSIAKHLNGWEVQKQHA